MVQQQYDKFPWTFSFHGQALDNETITIARPRHRTRIEHLMFETSGALGASLSIDLVDGGPSGTGTTVIQASSDNLNGSETFTLDHIIDPWDYINLTADNYAAGVDITVYLEGWMFIPA